MQTKIKTIIINVNKGVYYCQYKKQAASAYNTHLTVQGASKIAQFFVRDLKKQQHPLAAYIYREQL